MMKPNVACSTGEKEFQDGVLAFRRGDLEKAYGHFSKAIEAGQNSVKVYDSRAAVLERQEKHKEALDDARKCIELNPNAFQGYARAAQLFFALSKFSKAAVMVEKAIALTSENARRLASLKELQGIIIASQNEDSKCRIDKLPTELLLYLFLYVSKEEEFSTRHLVLSGVCTRWRIIITSDPRFWTDLVIPNRHARLIIDLWMKCSRGKLEQLCIPASLNSNQSRSAISHLAITRGCPPVRTLKLHLRHIEQFVNTGGGKSLFSPQHTRRLELRDDENNTHTDWTVALAFFPPQSQLEHIKVIGCSLLIRDLPVLKLKHLELVFPPFIIYSPVLDVPFLLGFLESQNRESMETLIFRMQGYNTALTEYRPIAMPKLRALALEIKGNAPWREGISCFHIPLLTSLCLKGLSRPMEEYLDAINPPDAIEHLNLLALGQCHFNEIGLLNHLKKMRKLICLELSDTGSPVGKIIDAIAESSTQGTERICPLLTHLDLTRGISSAEPCVRLVRARNITVTRELESNVVPLRYLNMDHCPDLDPNLLRYLEAKVPYFTAKAPRLPRPRARRV